MFRSSTARFLKRCRPVSKPLQSNNYYLGGQSARTKSTTSKKSTRHALERKSQKQSNRFSSAIADASASGIAAKKAASSSSAASTKGAGSLLPMALVSSPQVRMALPIIGNGAYMALVSGFLMTDMLQLRVALVGGYTGLVAFHALHPNPLKIPLTWSAVFILVNAGAACLLIYDQYGAPLSEDDEGLYLEHFSHLTRGQYYQLMQMSTTERIPDNEVLTVEGKISPNLYFLKSGRAKVFHHQTFAANIDAGGFVNDVAFQQQVATTTNESMDSSKGGAYGTVITNGECEVIQFNCSELREHLKTRPEMERNMKYTLSEHLMKSLLKQREARHAKQQRALQRRQAARTQLTNDDDDDIAANGAVAWNTTTTRNGTTINRPSNNFQGDDDNGPALELVRKVTTM